MEFHKSNLGHFGDDLPCDMQGYVRTEAAEILAAQDEYDTAGNGISPDEADSMAADATRAVARAENALEEWRVNYER